MIKASNAKSIVTTSNRFFSSNNRLYIKCKGNIVIGFIKVGLKNLFLRKEEDEFDDYSVLCVLDFFVHETIQRKGFGKVNFVKKRKFLKKC